MNEAMDEAINNSMNWIGWVSSGLLVLTILKQLHKQWREKTAEGVSIWLFGGQIVAEIGFVIYSYIGKNWVFLVTNSALLALNIAGFLMTRHFRNAAKFSPNA